MMNLLMIMKKIMIFSKKVLNILYKKYSKRRIERPNIDKYEDLFRNGKK